MNFPGAIKKRKMIGIKVFDRTKFDVSQTVNFYTIQKKTYLHT